MRSDNYDALSPEQVDSWIFEEIRTHWSAQLAMFLLVCVPSPVYTIQGLAQLNFSVGVERERLSIYGLVCMVGHLDT